MNSTSRTVLAVVFGIGYAANVAAAHAAAAPPLAPVTGETTARPTMQVEQLAQAGQAAKSPPNDVFTPVQTVGPWRIQKVYRDGKFHRCRAELGSVPNQLLIVKWASRNWGVAIANTGKLGPNTKHKMALEIGRSSESFEGLVDAFGLYLTKVVPQGTIDAIRSASRFQLTTPMGTQAWDLSNTGSMVGGLDDCVNANIGNAPGGTQAGTSGSGKEVFTQVGTVANWRIVKVYRDNKFHRCRAELGKGVQGANVVKWATRQWGLSLNARGLKAGSKHQMEVEMGRSSEVLNAAVDGKGDNLTANLTESLLSGLRSSSHLQIKTPTNNQSYSLTSISTAIGAVEDCFNANIGNS